MDIFVKIIKIMGKFFQNVFATLVGIFLFIFFIFLIIIGAGISSAFKSKPSISANAVLKLNLNTSIVDYHTKDTNPFVAFNKYFGSDTPAPIGLVQLKTALEAAAKDTKIKGILLEATFPQTGYANIEEVRNQLLAFKKSGKFIISYGEFYEEKGYYLSTTASEMYLNPTGIIDFNGISAEYNFFKGALDKLEIKPVIFKVGTFKSAVEPFLLDKMSEANRLQTHSFLGSINNNVFGNIAAARKITSSQVKMAADSLQGFKANTALQAKLIDKLGYYSDVEKNIAQKLKLEKDKKINFVNFEKYTSTLDETEEADSDDAIAVLSAEGEIVGNGSDEGITSENFIKQLTKLKEDEDVKAIVLRINSPGGSALASDIMWNEIQQTRKTKPVIASFSDYAASGGYYMGMGTDGIVAQPNTITGSIGIFMMLFNAENFLKNKLGITSDTVNTNAHSSFPSVTLTMSDFENRLLQSSVNEGYHNFTSKAAAGRKMPIEKLKAVAEGRVWSGTQAKAIGLVDQLGGLQQAIELAASKAKLKIGKYNVQYAKQKKSFWDKLMDKSEETAEATLIQKTPLLKTVKQIEKSFNQLQKTNGLQARMEYELHLR